MSRIDDLTARMISAMPLPAPTPGSARYAIVKLWAAAIAGAPIATLSFFDPGYFEPDYMDDAGHAVEGQEPQDGAAIQQMVLGATLVRNDAAPTDWAATGSAGWRFAPAAGAAGASDVFLDAWGKSLQVPRYRAELDAAYAPRIVGEVVSPSTTNLGLAALIDTLLGMTGTKVLEGEGFFTPLRLNDGHRLNNGKRLMGFGAFGAETLWNTFVVVLPHEATNPTFEVDVRALCDRKRGAGNRLLGVVVASPAVITTVAMTAVDAVETASVPAFVDTTYVWSVTGGTILSGQGTNSITYTPTIAGVLVVSVVATVGAQAVSASVNVTVEAGYTNTTGYTSDPGYARP